MQTDSEFPDLEDFEARKVPKFLLFRRLWIFVRNQHNLESPKFCNSFLPFLLSFLVGMLAAALASASDPVPAPVPAPAPASFARHGCSVGICNPRFPTHWLAHLAIFLSFVLLPKSSLVS
jgi:hypothetical protein